MQVVSDFVLKKSDPFVIFKYNDKDLHTNVK